MMWGQAPPLRITHFCPRAFCPGVSAFCPWSIRPSCLASVLSTLPACPFRTIMGEGELGNDGYAGRTGSIVGRREQACGKEPRPRCCSGRHQECLENNGLAGAPAGIGYGVHARETGWLGKERDNASSRIKFMPVQDPFFSIFYALSLDQGS